MPIIESTDDLKKKCAESRAKRKAKKGFLTKTGNPVGRPKGGNLQVKVFNDAVESGDVQEAYKALLKVSKDPDHKHFASAMKMLLDRTAHVSNYEKANSNSTPTININIGDTDKPVTISGEVVDG